MGEMSGRGEWERRKGEREIERVRKRDMEGKKRGGKGIVAVGESGRG